MTNLIGELSSDLGEEAKKESFILLGFLLQSQPVLLEGSLTGSSFCLLDVLATIVILQVHLGHLPREALLLSLGVLSDPNAVIHPLFWGGVV